MARQDLKYADLTEKVIGCAMKVHRTLGPGFPEIVYKRCLMIELEKEGINFVSEQERVIIYEGRAVGKRRLDLLVETKVLVELKAVMVVDNFFPNQILNYLKIFKIEVGFLLNFGNASLKFKRFINSAIS